MINLSRKVLGRVSKAILLTTAALYLLIDLLFLSVVRPLRRRIMALRWVIRSRDWVHKLNRYAALVLLVVPWLILEPIKPIGVFLFSHNHHLAATLLIIAGEVVKLTLFEQLFDMTKPKLLTFRWFAWSYSRWRDAIDYMRSLPVWHRMHERYRTIRTRVQHRWYLG
jgi:hypothetical protein